MTAREQLLQEIQHSQESLIQEVLDFLLFAKSKHSPKLEVAEKEVPHQPIWEFAEELMRDATPEDLEYLPPDGARNHDHYLYGAPKQL